MKPLLAIVAGLLGTGLLAYLCAAGHRNAIQQDLTDRTKAALAQSSVRELSVAVDGRELTLRGVVPSEEAKREAQKRAQKVYGVRTVTNLLEIRVPSPLLPSSPPPVETSPVVPPAASRTMPAPQAPKSAPEQRSPAQKSPVVTPSTPKPPVQKALTTSQREPLPSKGAPCQKMLEAALRDGQIQFESGKAVLRPQSYSALDRLAGAAKKCAGIDVEVSGHTDSRGTRSLNMKLSKERAQAVIAYLRRKGVPAQRLTAIAHGPSKPLASNTTDAGMRRNRRAEVTIKNVPQSAR
ncbi:MAG: BON domain-containing protein [Deltaproteobacteria bacterium]|nr:BON domain-containing protein [Deltaproteobacteria bacterium]